MFINATNIAHLNNLEIVASASEFVKQRHFCANYRIPASLIRALVAKDDFNMPLERNGAFITTAGGNSVLAVAIEDSFGNIIAYDLWNNPFDD